MNIEEIERLFDESRAPFTLREIADRLGAYLGGVECGGRVYRALATLRTRPATAPLVAPLDARAPALYSHESARRIARHVARSKPPRA